MASLTLPASPRTVLGKQVKRLRKAGLIPGVIYGHRIPSQPIQISVKDLERVAKQAGNSGLVQVNVDGESRGRTVVVRRLTADVLSRLPLHVDLYQVQMDEPMLADVPLQLTGEAPAVKAENGIVLPLLTHLRVRALPGQMPTVIAVDVSGLSHVDDALYVRDLQLPEGVETTADPEVLVTKVNAPRIAVEIAEEEAAAEAEAVAEAAAEESESED